MKTIKEMTERKLGRVYFMIIGLLVLASTGCSQPQALVYQDLRNFRVHAANLQQATVVLDLQFYNPNNYSLDAYFNDKYLGKATLDERTAIPARDTFLMPVSVTANLGDILTNVMELLTNGNQEVMVRLEGNVRAGKGGIFIGVPVRYKGLQHIHL